MANATESTAVEAEFTQRADPFRRELLAHCYRMTGSLDDAEDMVQETYVRAWRAYGDFEGRSSLRKWLYSIATNVCLTELRRGARRSLPSGISAPSADPDATAAGPPPGVEWVQPLPDALVAPASDDPSVVAESRASLRLALIASLQILPPRQRAVVILREVLAWSAAEVADALGVTTPAVKSLLQRARARIQQEAPAEEDLVEPTLPEERALLDAYMGAFERSDVRLLEQVLRADAAIEVLPSSTWFSGLATCLRYLSGHAVGTPGDWRMLPTAANGQPAAAAYLLAPDGSYRAFGVGVLTVTGGRIVRITAFTDPDLVARFALPASLPG